jgi:hypothetical protein
MQKVSLHRMTLSIRILRIGGVAMCHRWAADGLIDVAKGHRRGKRSPVTVANGPNNSQADKSRARRTKGNLYEQKIGLCTAVSP